jgi:cytochrome P450
MRMMTDSWERLAAVPRSDDGITEIHAGLWLVTDPVATERLLASPHARTARADHRTTVTSWGPDGLTTWMAVRRAMRPILTASRIAPSIPVIAEQVRRIVADWDSPGTIDATRAAVRLVSTVNIRHLLGQPSAVLPGLVEEELSIAARARSMFRPARRRLLRAQRATYTAIRHHLSDRTVPATLPAALTDHGFDEHTVTLAVRTMLLSSHHVPAAALAWVLHELSVRPDIQEQARIEAATHQDPTSDLPLCQTVIRETLRLHPPIWQLQRRLAEPAHGLPRDATLLFSPYLNHRDRNTYAHPDEFSPQRWSPGLRPTPGAYFPFALGPRFCPGSALALAELAIILATVLRTHRLTPHRPPIPPRGGLHAPNGLRLRLNPVE